MVCHALHDVILERLLFTAKLSSPVYAVKSAGDYRQYVCVVNPGLDVQWHTP